MNDILGPRGNLSRRGFLARSLAALTVGAGLPVWYAREMLAYGQDTPARQTSPNSRITMAAIGTGTNRTRRRNDTAPLHGERGYQIMVNAMRVPGVQMVAVCDVDRPNAEFAAREVNRRNGNNDCRVYTDFRELLRRNDIDAVTIATPDHWHAIIANEAMKAGKDVYCEKPLTLTLAEGQVLALTSRRTGKILQTGSQQRTEYNGRFRLACELVRNGRIGRVVRIETRIGSNPTGGPFPVVAVPEGLDWNFWLGPTPRVDYVKERCHYDFRWWYEYSGGKMTDWGAHHNDVAQWALNMDDSGPIMVEATADAADNRPNCYNCHPNFQVTYTYGNGTSGGSGTILRCTSRGENGVRFEGENGRWIFVSRSTITASDRRIIDEPLPQNAIRLPVVTADEQNRNNLHMVNFIRCVRSRQQPICNVNVGHRSCSVCHIGNIAIRTGLRLRWDPQQERFIGENADRANALLSRPMREPWTLEPAPERRPNG